MSFVTLEDTIRTCHATKDLDNQKKASILLLCRQACGEIEKQNPQSQHRLLTDAEKWLNRNRDHAVLDESLALSVVWRYHSIIFLNNINSFYRNINVAFARLFDLHSIAGHHNFYSNKKHSLFAKSLGDEAIFHYDNAIETWEKVKNGHENWAYRYSSISSVYLRNYILQPEKTHYVVCLLDAAEHAINNKKLLKDKDLRNIDVNLSTISRYASSIDPKISDFLPRIAGLRNKISS